ncbi:hypothetical protein HA052_19390 [Chromobacterium haemolyticum]|uniref:DUF3617 family protein n=1 Tax=Chromobacterium fluminis TaxID=3044269 RepID=A0ABX0L6C3_9NEIS|nr:hypothetical protein [Chromobacterium haemolyticum]NHR07357.1 hypothetical protein [Chromobacterium haemolyticum]
MKPISAMCMLAGLLATLTMGAANAAITFKKGWNDPANSDVKTYTQAEATTYLRNKSDALKEMIDKSACQLNVSKGCHQKSDSHFTLDGIGSKASCKNIYAGSKSIHTPCP